MDGVRVLALSSDIKHIHVGLSNPSLTKIEGEVLDIIVLAFPSSVTERVIINPLPHTKTSPTAT